MYFLLSGEGSGDMGRCAVGELCERLNFQEGPMAIIVDQLTQAFQGYESSFFDTERVSFASERWLTDNRQPAQRKSAALPGKKREQGTIYFYKNARALAVAAKNLSSVVSAPVIAVLFRDSDGTASAGRGHWQDKRASIINGFAAESFELGVAMVPKPKSEAWLLCATQQNPYQHCVALEDESGNDASPNPLKKQFSVSLKGRDSTAEVNDLLRSFAIDIHQIDMPSFDCFKTDLKHAVQLAGQRTNNGH